jgi:flotillin
MDSPKESQQNTYLGEVLQQQVKVDQELRRKRSASPAGVAASTRPGSALPSAPLPPARAIDYRITGFLWWKNVIVPPNVYVIHTRRGQEMPVTVGLGISFSFNPYLDSFLLVPAAMQTIVINARCICAERQGILVQAYVQWIIDDIETAYRRLDFSDPEDPMHIVNVQLREQAEAAIKDKVATMSIDAVLADKQPIIEELTHRLRVVAEGNHAAGKTSGLGLKIVTVQIKEAVVSSTRLWESLQKPFRAEREKVARLAELEAHQVITARELETRKQTETLEVATERELAQHRADAARERSDRAHQDAVHHTELERQAIDARNPLVQAQRDLQVANLQHEQALAESRSVAHLRQEERLISVERARSIIENEISDSHLKAQLVAKLPEIAKAMPRPAELRTVQVNMDGQGGGGSTIGSLFAGLLALISQASAEMRPGRPGNENPDGGGS